MAGKLRPTLLLFVVLALLHIAPIWSVHYLPTGDGPSHIYNAWILHGLLTGDAPPHIARAYQIDWKPHPNWTGHLLMAAAIAVVPPLVAEKLLVTFILVMLLAGAWFLNTSIDPRNSVYAFLAFPFLYAQTLVAGYYNYTLGVALFLFILGYWWRHRQRPSPASVVVLAVLLVLAYFSHPMSALLGCGSIVLLSLLLGRFAQLVALVPVSGLLVLFGRTEGSNVGAPLKTSIDWGAARILVDFDTIYSFGEDQRPIALTVAFACVTLILVTHLLDIRDRMRDRPRDANAIAGVVLALIAMMFWIPTAAGTRDLFTGRSQLFILLTLPAWFTPSLTRRWRAALLAALSLLAVANAAVVWKRIHGLSADVERLVRAFDPIEPDTTLLPLPYDRPHSESYVDVFVHAISYVALEKRLVDLANYEPSTQYFPIAHRGPALGSHLIDTNPGSIDLAQPVARADYVATYQLTRDAPNYQTLNFLYALVKDDGVLRIHHRRAPITGAFDLVLLPLLGTRTDLGAPAGARWRIDQQIRNRGPRPVRVLFRECLNDLPCELRVEAGQSIPVASSDRRFTFVRVPRGSTELLEVTTVARRTDVNRPETSVPIPAAPERAFSRGGTRLANIDTRQKKVGLRVYVFGEAPRHEVAFRLRAAGGGVVSERKFEVDNFGMFDNAELRSEVGGAPLPPLTDIEIEVAPDVRVWAFVTTTDADGRALVQASEAP
jgi:hypothetical protein